jgi:predicted DNA-binding antitoxin AbrB/MazE fold protein
MSRVRRRSYNANAGIPGHPEREIMSIEVEATYEKGSFKLDQPLPVAEHQRVRIIVQSGGTVAEQSYGILGWKGDVKTVRKAALDK